MNLFEWLELHNRFFYHFLAISVEKGVEERAPDFNVDEIFALTRFFTPFRKA
jgi:hypothetical protein